MKRTIFIILCCLALGLAGCTSAKPTATLEVALATSAVSATPQPAPVSLATQTSVPATLTSPAALPTAIAVSPSATPEPSTATAVPPSTAAESGLAPLPADPQRIEFESEDGAMLVGMYYPAAVNPAPVVVLMHWARGDKNDWIYVGMAAWLQNRGLEIPPAPGSMPFDTPYPFISLPADLSFGVFLFDFRSFGESAPSSLPFSQLGPLWQADARAAYAKARNLPGVDPAQVVGIGASIGADAVVDACGVGCLGALSLGPGSYLNMPYQEAVSKVDEAGKPVWCIGAENDAAAAQACHSASGVHYQFQIYAAGGHAMSLFRAENKLQPTLDSVIIDFLKLTLNLLP
jgi:dienelactone hydrolase